ncbi:Poly [ADP-ribose] polymerase 3 [Clydaea vesicula]|uniref:Poly [ADP-ribose] polymerase n=1 Tax=Clydaea vesicula TaxID=447962 RepID=A0AAD5U4X2_9FUNG|nr:Poly [ADP-ribose] polymerase 3 [Clydaea vesicula]
MARAKKTKIDEKPQDALADPPLKKQKTEEVMPAVDDVFVSSVSCTNPACVSPFAATLNQTNINANNNKFYKIQLFDDGNGKYYLGTRWGRVGEKGQSKVAPVANLEKGEAEFKKTFKSKTANNWDDRDSFTFKSGKYDLIKVNNEASAENIDEINKKAAGREVKQVETLPCTLDNSTQDVVEMIFSSDMFKDAMAKMDLDVNKLPLGALSQSQVQAGYDALAAIETELRAANPSTNQLERLSSYYFTVIPHSFGRQRPPILNTIEKVQERFDFMAVLSDIEKAQKMKEVKEEVVETKELCKHPTNVLYEGLDADARYNEHDNLGNRKLLWHGTNVAVVAAILKSGLRIMPHSGGRVGKGIYLANMQEKSLVMFLAEAALGKEYHIYQDDSSLTEAPKGYDSVVAMGTRNSDPSEMEKLTIDDKEVMVPLGTEKEEQITSTFYNSEYLIYKESQHRLRYLLVL